MTSATGALADETLSHFAELQRDAHLTLRTGEAMLLNNYGDDHAQLEADVRVGLPEEARDQVAAIERVRLVAHAHGWRPQSDVVGESVTISPPRP